MNGLRVEHLAGVAISSKRRQRLRGRKTIPKGYPSKKKNPAHIEWPGLACKLVARLRAILLERYTEELNVGVRG
jgi:hypothetical protein